MDIQTAISDTQQFVSDPPPNESSTCEWIIVPLLLAAGYMRRDILPRASDNNRQFPDYTLLPQDPEHTWFLEAKAWSVLLEDRHAHQSLNYANQNGKRWVILSNGREWRLYDNDIRGLPSDKLVVEAHLEDSENLSSLLLAIGKDAILSGSLEDFADRQRQEREQRAEETRQRREKEIWAAQRERDERERGALLATLLPERLSDEGSSLLRAMCDALSSETGLEGIKTVDLARYFRELTPMVSSGTSTPEGTDLWTAICFEFNRLSTGFEGRPSTPGYPNVRLKPSLGEMHYEWLYWHRDQRMDVALHFESGDPLSANTE